MRGVRVKSIGQLFGENGVNGGYCPVTVGDKETWMVRTPNGHVGNLANHEVSLLPDGSITVTPSILVSDETGELYHGYLTRGQWVPC